jgi:hypothetical protein
MNACTFASISRSRQPSRLVLLAHLPSEGASFEFLLEREPATSILREFSPDVISQYFPGYPAEIRARLGSSDPGTPR